MGIFFSKLFGINDKENIDDKFENRKFIIKIYWTRHALSCANILKAIGEAGVKTAIKSMSVQDSRARYAPDPLLSNLGVVQSLNLNEKTKDLNNIDFIGCSELRRAIETAIIGYHNQLTNQKNKKVLYLLPFISELRSKLALGQNLDNFPIDGRNYSKNEHFEKLNLKNKGEILQQLNYCGKKVNLNFDDVVISRDYIKFGKYGEKLPLRKRATSADKFLDSLLPRIINQIYKEKIKEMTDINKSENKSIKPIEMNIVLVSHNHFITEIIRRSKNVYIDDKKQKLPKGYKNVNASIIKQEIIFDGSMIKKFVEDENNPNNKKHLQIKKWLNIVDQLVKDSTVKFIYPKNPLTDNVTIKCNKSELEMNPNLKKEYKETLRKFIKSNPSIVDRCEEITNSKNHNIKTIVEKFSKKKKKK